MVLFVQRFKRFLASEDGVTMVEYGLIAALIAITIIAALVTLSSNISSEYSTISSVV